MRFENMTAPAVLDRLRAQDWDAFAPERDLPSLRTALAELERTCGVTEAHRFATRRLRERGALLRHPDVHLVEISAQALSPSGRYLAAGSWFGDDFDRGGALQVWEVATGRCVNVIAGIDGAVGCIGYGNLVQWSADETRVAMLFWSRAVGVWDPFGTRSEPPGGGVCLHASSSVLPFAFAPDGVHAFVFDEGASPGSIVSLEVGESSARPLRGDDEEDDEDEWNDANGEPDDNDENGEPEDPEDLDDPLEDSYLDRVAWSRDGQRLYGELNTGQVCSIDVDSGRARWVAPVSEKHGPPAEWSRDERLVAFHQDHALVIADAADGRALARLPAYRDVEFLSWGARLAVVMADRVAIVDRTGAHPYELDLALRRTPFELDVRTWAWAPGDDDERAACLTDEGRIEIWSLGDERGERLRSFDAPEGTGGVLWGADGVVVALGGTVLRFLRAESGEVISDVTLLRQPPGPRPLEIEGADLGDEPGPEPDPTFALDADTWAVAFPPGVVIAPAGREEDLAATLAWSVDRRFAWPVHWGELEVVPDAPAAAERVPEPLRTRLEPFRGRKAAEPEPPAWPPTSTAGVDDLFRVFQESVLEYRAIHERDHWGWSDAALHEAAVIRARRGEPAQAVELVGLCSKSQQGRTAADVALLLACAGFRDETRALLARYEAVFEKAWGEPTGMVGALGGACAALGDGERADHWFTRAHDAIRKHNGSGDHRLPVVRALMECGRMDEARALLGNRPRRANGAIMMAFLGYLLRKGWADLAAELLRSGYPFEDWEAAGLFAAYGQPRLLEEWGERFNRAVMEDHLPVAERNAARGRPTEPTGEDIEALARAHAEILRMPPAQRQAPIAHLALRAATCRHLGAVLDLLSRLPMPRPTGLTSNERPWVALSALRLVTTGVDVEPW